MTITAFPLRVFINTDFWLSQIQKIEDRDYTALDSEWPNLLNSVHFALAYPETRNAAAELWFSMLGYIESRGLLEDWHQVAEKVAEFVGDLPEETSCRIANELGFFFCKVKNFEQARAMHQMALETSVLHQFRFHEGMALLGYGNNLIAETKESDAEPYVQQALLILDELDAGRLHYASALNCLGLVEQSRGHYRQSETHFRQAFDFFAGVDHRRKAIVALHNLAKSQNLDGRPREAIESLMTVEGFLDPEKEIEAWTNYHIQLGIAWFTEGDYSKAKACFLRIDQPYLEENGLLDHLAHTTNNLGNVALKEADWQLACDYLAYSIAISRQLQNRLYVANSLGDLAEAKAHLRLHTDALKHLDEAIEILQGFPEHAWASRRLAAIKTQRTVLLS